jgi:hypothetical protein
MSLILNQNRLKKIEKLKECIVIIEKLESSLDEIVEGTALEPHFKYYKRYGIDQLLNNTDKLQPSIETLIEGFKKEMQ